MRVRGSEVAAEFFDDGCLPDQPLTASALAFTPVSPARNHRPAPDTPRHRQASARRHSEEEILSGCGPRGWTGPSQLASVDASRSYAAS